MVVGSRSETEGIVAFITVYRPAAKVLRPSSS
jgi:hypothetical protein